MLNGQIISQEPTRLLLMKQKSLTLTNSCVNLCFTNIFEERASYVSVELPTET